MLKLGSQTNSLSNHILSRAVIGQPIPKIGMGATLLGWTDRHPGTIVNVNKNVVTVQEDFAKRIDGNGMSESQEYRYAPNTSGMLYHFRRKKNGSWEEVSYNSVTRRYKKTGGYGLHIGERNKYYDFSF